MRHPTRISAEPGDADCIALVQTCRGLVSEAEGQEFEPNFIGDLLGNDGLRAATVGTLTAAAAT